jgi:DNA-directed RNA polymerase specialized sigma24 family protein
MQSTLNEAEASVWPQIAPLLDDALGKLGDRDRNAFVLRFFENKSLQEVGTALGASEDAAKMRRRCV